MKESKWRYYPYVTSLFGIGSGIYFIHADHHHVFWSLSSGFNFGFILAYSLHHKQLREIDRMTEFMRRTREAKFESALDEAKELVEARLQAKHVNPDLN